MAEPSPLFKESPSSPNETLHDDWSDLDGPTLIDGDPKASLPGRPIENAANAATVLITYSEDPPERTRVSAAPIQFTAEDRTRPLPPEEQKALLRAFEPDENRLVEHPAPKSFQAAPRRTPPEPSATAQNRYDVSPSDPAPSAAGPVRGGPIDERPSPRTSKVRHPADDGPGRQRPGTPRATVGGPHERLRVSAEDIVPRRAKKPAGTGRAPARRPREGPSLSQINRLTGGASGLSQAIPLILAGLVLLASLAIGLSLFKSGGQQEHVELRFLPVGAQNDSSIRQGSDLATRVIIETQPAGVLVVFDNRILGKTPLDEVLPLAVDGPVGLQLSGPYFKTWLEQVSGGGEIHVQAALTKGR